MTGVPISRSEFFGKDSFVPFIGRIEDVNDPKESGRVKVRCIGWHPKSKKGSESGDEDGLTTDDLPWARVSYPSTMPQQSRIGGKHGLLNGCWVWGFFLDGEEAQDPMVCSTFNFTSRSTEEDNRVPLQGEDGKDAEEDEAFGVNLNSPQTQPGSALRTREENNKGFAAQSDPSGHGWNADYDGVKCGGEKPLQSKEAYIRQNEENTKQTPQAQADNILQGDGRCGTNKHSKNDIKIHIKKHLPSASSRFNYEDAVWDRYSGKYMNLNGILAQLAKFICAELKQPINSKKARQNEKNRETRSKETISKPDRDGVDRNDTEKKLAIKDDAFNATVQTSFIDTLCNTMLRMLQAIDSGTLPGLGENPGGNIGTNPIGIIENPGADCIADTILSNIDKMTDEAIEEAVKIAIEFALNFNFKKDETYKKAIELMRQLAGGVMFFPVIDNYANVTNVFNVRGTESQDKGEDGSGEECRDDRVYNTERGAFSSSAGGKQFNALIGGQGGLSQGAGVGSSFNKNRDRLFNIGFGGLEINVDENGVSVDSSSGATGGSLVCDEAYLPVVPDDGIPVVTPGTDFIPCDQTTDCPSGFLCVDGRCVPYGDWFPPNDEIGTGTPSLEVDRVEPGDFRGIGEEGYVEGASNIFDDPFVYGLKPGENAGIVVPSGTNAHAIAISLPSSDASCAKNFINGTPNQVFIQRRGKRYFFNNPDDARRVFPSIYIKGYNAQPIPVVDRASGEMVAILTACSAFNPNFPSTPITIIPDDSTTGITTDDPAYDISLGGLHIANTGFDYTDPKVVVRDRDRDNGDLTAEIKTAEIKLVVQEGRIVDYEIINSSKDFRRIPDIRVIDANGFGAKLYPIMSVAQRDTDKPTIPDPVNMVYCPANQQNLY